MADPLNTDAVKSVLGGDADPRRAEREQAYRDLVGFVPPRITARLTVTGALDPELLSLQEELRARAMYPACFDTKTAQLIIFAMLVMTQKEAAMLHARAARKAGASWEELHGAVGLAFIYGGYLSANQGTEIIARLAQEEHEAAKAAG